MSSTSGILGVIKSPLGYMVLLVSATVFAAMTVASSISGDLTAAAINAAGFSSIVFILAAVKVLGR